MSFIVTPSTPAAPTAPGGADTQIQFNDAGAFGGSANMTFDGSVTRLNSLKGINSSFSIIADSTLILSGPGTADAKTAISITAGNSSTGSDAGALTFTGGSNTSSGASGGVNIYGGYSSSTGSGGAVFIRGGGTAGSSPGNVTLRAGLNSGSTQNGYVKLQSGVGQSIVSVGGYIGTALLGFYGVVEIQRPTTSVAAATFVAGAGVAVQDVSTFDGYTIAKVVKALRNLGLLT